MEQQKIRHCESMENYMGPDILFVKLDERDVTSQIKQLYGSKHDWRCRWWTFADVFSESAVGKRFRIEYESGEYEDTVINRLQTVLNWKCEYGQLPDASE